MEFVHELHVRPALRLYLTLSDAQGVSLTA